MMATLAEAYPLLKALWVMWFMLVFVVMLALVLRPSRRQSYARAAHIPLADETPRAREIPPPREAA
jgi:cbb3-type cytochrome oxidase subunit 3